jgi:hypothetical protein
LRSSTGKAAMPDDFKILLTLVLVFVPLSLLSIGGGAALLAETRTPVGHRPWVDHPTRIRRPVRDLTRRPGSGDDALDIDRLESGGALQGP